MTFFEKILEWIRREHLVYEELKFDQDSDDAKTAEEWEERITMYLHRAKILGLDTPVGRQAVMKAATTAVVYGESVLRNYGSVPPPGVNSGFVDGEYR